MPLNPLCLCCSSSLLSPMVISSLFSVSVFVLLYKLLYFIIIIFFEISCLSDNTHYVFIWLLQYPWGPSMLLQMRKFIIFYGWIFLGKCITKQRHHFADKGPYSQSYGFPIVMCGCESWTIKKAENRRIDVFEMWCWRRLFRVPWTARRSNQSILKEINSAYSLEGLMLKLKSQYFGHLK